MPATKLSPFEQAYVEAALWSSNDESDPETGGEPLDRNYGVEDIAPDTLAKMREDCQAFRNYLTRTNTPGWVEALDELLDNDPGQAGHDFWLTRNGHGAGFWDGDWPETAGKILTAASKTFGEFNLYIGDDGLIHGM